MSENKKGWLKSQWDDTQALNDRLISRVERWNTLYQAGGGTTSEYVFADFNTHCPQGLEIEEWSNQTIKLESLFKSDNYKNANIWEKILSLRWSGWVQNDEDTKIHINPLSFSPQSLELRGYLDRLKGNIPRTLADLLPHEFIHTRQHYSDRSGWYRNSGNDLKDVGLGQLSKSRQIWRKAVRIYQDISTAISLRSDTISNYYAQDAEMQARMHEILAYGYVQWQRLPNSKIELWAALSNAGFETPARILNKLNETAEGQKALKDFKLFSGLKSRISGLVYTFNIVHEYAGEKDIQEALWTTKYPLLYGELIEFYGDKLGRARMDVGNNPRPVIQVLYAMQANKEPFCKEDAEELVSQIPPSLAAPFLNTLIANYSQDDQNVILLSGALLAREDVKKTLFADSQIVRAYAQPREDPPLDTALRHGHLGMVKLLIQAGADPYQKFNVIDMRGANLYTATCVDCARDIEYYQNGFSDPNKFFERDRAIYKDRQKREEKIALLEIQKPALREMLDCFPKSDLSRKLYIFEDEYEEISLIDLLARADIIEKRPESQMHLGL